jgi:hypothetical protein
MILLSTVTATNVATADLETTFNSTYDNYVIMATGVIGELNARTKYMLLKVGGTYQTGGYTSASQSIATNSGSTTNTTSTSEIAMYESHYAESYPTQEANFIAYIRNPSNTTKLKPVNFMGAGFAGASNGVTIQGGGCYTASTGAITGVRFQCSAGNITGTFRLYGIKNS